MTFIAWLIQSFGLQMKKMFIKKVTLVMYVASFLQLWTKNKSKNIQK